MELLEPMTKIDELVAEVQALPVEARIRIMNTAMESLNPPDAAREKLWATEAKNRLAEYRAGRIPANPGEAVFARLLGKYQK